MTDRAEARAVASNGGQVAEGGCGEFVWQFLNASTMIVGDEASEFLAANEPGELIDLTHVWGN